MAVPGHGWIAVFVTPPRVRTEVVIDGLPVPQPAEQRQIPPDPPPIVVDAQLAPVVQAPSGAPPPTTPASPTVDGPVATPPRSPLLWIPLAFVALMAMLYVGAIGLILGVKRLRTRRRRREPDPADRIANGWDELVDLARDAGRTVPIELTRAEMATQIGLPGAAHLAAAADTLVFARERPSDHEADRYWNDVELAREHLLVQLDRRARHRVRLNMTSLRH